MKHVDANLTVVIAVGSVIFLWGLNGVRRGIMETLGLSVSAAGSCKVGIDNGRPCTDKERVALGLPPRPVTEGKWIFIGLTGMVIGGAIVVPSYLLRSATRGVSDALEYESLAKVDQNLVPSPKAEGPVCPHCNARCSEIQVYCWKCGKQMK